MIILFTMLPIISSFACLPGYLITNHIFLRRDQNRESVLFIFSVVPSLAVSFLLFWLNVGQPVLEDIVEVIYLSIIGVISAYIKMIVIDRFLGTPKTNTYILIIILTLLPLVIRCY